MKKNLRLYTDQIDLMVLLKIILNAKKKILLNTIISFLIGIGYSYQRSSDYLISLTISKNDNSKLSKINYIERLINQNQNQNNNITNQIILDKFIYELEDYKEFLFNLRNTKKIKEKILELPLEKQENELYKYRKLLDIDKKPDLTLKFKWDNIDEAKYILQNTVNHTLNNLKKLIYEDLYLLLEHKKKLSLATDLKRIEFLKEQSWIAKELNISDYQIGNFNLNYKSNYQNTPYYLVGYKAIDKEIELIENRSYERFDRFKQQINSMEKESVDWIYYDIQSANTKFLKNTRLIILTSILLGLIFGAFYAVFSDILKFKTIFKKRY